MATRARDFDEDDDREMAPTSRFCCDVCGRMQTGLPNQCSHCRLAVCDRCWFSQGGRGHEWAEHGNEIRFERLGYDPTLD